MVNQKPRPIVAEAIGEAGVGKTHSAATPRDILFIDTSSIGEADIVLEKLHPDENIDDIYQHCITFKEVIEAIRMISDKTKTVSIDSGSYLRKIAGNEWKKRSSRSGIYPEEYGQVDEIILDEIIYPIVRKHKKNLFMTGIMRDEYVNDKKSGRREGYGFPKNEFLCDIRIHMFLTPEGKRSNTILKNRFADTTQPNAIKSLSEVTWTNIQKLSGLPQERLI